MEPITLAVVGTVALTEGIKFLHAQTGEVLKHWRERRNVAESGVATSEDSLLLDVKLSEVFKGQLLEPKIHFDVVEQLEKDLRAIRNELTDYAQDIEKVDNRDEALLAKTDALRRLLEAILQVHITFKGEKRPPSGPVVQGSIDVEQVAVYAAAVRAKRMTGGLVEGEAKAKRVESGGQFIGLDVDAIEVDTIDDSRVHGRSTASDDDLDLSDTTDRTRYVNTWFEGHPGPEQPLGYRRAYKLAIQVAPDLLPGSFTKDRLEFGEPDFAGEETVDIVAAVVSDDFEVLGRPTTRIALPRDKTKPSTIAYFRVLPVKNNQGVSISILFYRKNSLFHEASVGARVQVLEVDEQAEASSSSYFPTKEVLRRPFQGARDLNLQIVGHEDGYRLVVFYDTEVTDPEVKWCKVPVSPERVTDLVEGTRDRLLKVVHTEGALANDRRGRIFFDGEPKEAAGREKRLPKLLTIKDGICRDALQSLAQAGRLLYVNIFYSAGGTKVERDRAAQVGEFLRRLSRGQPLRVQVLSDDIFIPWNLLYDGDYPSGEIDPDEFWGFKHTIEEIPYQSSEEVPAIVPAEVFGIGMNLNRVDLPEELSRPQVAEVGRLAPNVRPDLRYTEEEVQAVLQGQRPQHSVEYFYCHAGTRGLRDADFDQSNLGLTDAESGLTLESIKLTTAGRRLPGKPLFFLNACESAQMDGRFYDGFVPKFLTMGASGIVGTDCEVPSLFAAHLGMACLEAFFGGETVGNSLLSARKEMLERYRNPLGLIYRVFGNSDVRLSRPVLDT